MAKSTSANEQKYIANTVEIVYNIDDVNTFVFDQIVTPGPLGSNIPRNVLGSELNNISGIGDIDEPHAGESFDISAYTDNDISWTDINTAYPIDDINIYSFGQFTSDVKQCMEYLFLGGKYNVVNSDTRNNVSVLSSHTNTPFTLYEWNPDCNNKVLTMLLDNEILYIGGEFTEVNDVERNHIAALHTEIISGQSILYEKWEPDCDDDVYVISITPSGDALFVGGIFSEVSGEERNCIVALSTDPTTACDIFPWNLGLDSHYSDSFLEESGGGGTGGISHHIKNSINCINFKQDAMFLGGFFRYNGRSSLVALSYDFMEETPILYPWRYDISARDFYNHKIPGIVKTIVLSDNCVFIGGRFNFIELYGGSVPRQSFGVVSNNLYDTNQIVYNFNLGASTVRSNYTDIFPKVEINDMKIKFDMPYPILYVCGNFTNVNAMSRSCLAAIELDLNTTNVNIYDWNPNIRNDSSITYDTSTVNSIILYDNKVYIGGRFTRINGWGGTTRNNITIIEDNIDESEPNVHSWDANCSDEIYTMIPACSGEIYKE